MTTIAWDGRTLAGDKRVTSVGLSRTITKVSKDANGLYAMSGDLPSNMAVLHWLTNGADPRTYPMPTKDNYSLVVHINLNKEIWVYENGPIPFKIEDEHYACGSGRDFALTAMHLGKTAVESILISSMFDTGTGNGVDFFTLEGICASI